MIQMRQGQLGLSQMTIPGQEGQLTLTLPTNTNTGVMEPPIGGMVPGQVSLMGLVPSANTNTGTTGGMIGLGQGVMPGIATGVERERERTEQGQSQTKGTEQGQGERGGPREGSVQEPGKESRQGRIQVQGPRWI
jgi:hypothetical protein